MESKAEAVVEIGSSAGMLRLRPEQEQDHAFRFRLFCQSRPEFALLPFDAAALDQFMRFQFLAQTTSYRSGFPNARFDIIELDGAPIGRIVVDRPGTVLHIVDQAIVPSLRNRGLGTTIMTALMQEAGRAGLRVRLTVAASNHASMRLYRRLGFAPVHCEPLHIEMEWPAPGAAG